MFEGIQWTMAHEIRGSMMVYLALVATSGLTSFYRTAVLFGLLFFSIYNDDDVLLNIPFFTGALLADLSLVLSNATAPIIHSSPRSIKLGGVRIQLHRIPWPLIIFGFAMFFGSYPPDSYEMAHWSQFLFNFGQIIFPYGCTSPCNPKY